MEETKGGEGMSVMNVDEPMVRITDALTIVVTNTSGETVSWQKDITEEFLNNPDRYIYIEEPEIDIPNPPTPPSSGGGFQPTVDDWAEENYDIAI